MFRTEIPLIPHSQQLTHSARVLTIGSCFAETMGTRLLENKVAAVVNPFGTVFNPLTACQLLRAAAGEDVDWQQHLVEARGRWQSYDLHATIGADSPVTLLQRIQEVVRETGEFLRTADVVMLTLGTAFVYRLRATGELVSNCHKVPAEQFEKELLTPDEIINAVAETHAYLRRHNPKLRFILTVSPVRHLKDTLPLNTVSKSTLRLACHYLSELLPDVAYFPAYELLLDDLRDYRFYADDMLHPSTVAQEYIWERFTRTYFDAAFGRFKKEWHALRQALHHRPLYEAAPEHRQFLETTLDRLRRLGQQVDVTTEIDAVQQQLLALPLPSVPELEPEPEDDEERIDIGEYAAAVAAAVVVPAEPVTVPELVAEVAQPEQGPEALPATPIVEHAEAVVDEAMAAQPKKKRRSRGGAKRTARKRAALEALAAQESTQTPPTEAVDIDVDVAEPAPVSTATSEEAVAAAEELATPVKLAVLATYTPETPEAVEEMEESGASKPRKGRTAGQILADKKKARRSSKNRGRQLTSLYATPENDIPDVSEPEENQSFVGPDTVETAAVAPTLPPTDTLIPAAPVAKVAEPTPALPEAVPVPAVSVAETAPAEVSPVTDDTDAPNVPAETSVPEAEPAPVRRATRAKAPAKPRASRSKKPTAAPESVDATVPKPAPFANPAPAKPTATRKKAAKPVAAAKAAPQPIAEPPAPETTPAAETLPAAPKRRSRPPRKKPAPTDDNTPAA